jgi:hypothetical protein
MLLERKDNISIKNSSPRERLINRKVVITILESLVEVCSMDRGLETLFSACSADELKYPVHAGYLKIIKCYYLELSLYCYHHQP